MKKTILLSSVLALGAAFAAEVASDNAIGALDLAIGAGHPDQVLIAVPFVAYDGGAVAVKDMVKTSDLDTGSKLYVPDGSGAYDTWKLDGKGEWGADTKVTVGAGGAPVEGASTSQDTATANRGDAFWLEPKFKNSATSGTIFLLGQGTTATGSSTVAAGWNLIGNASTEAVSLDKLAATDGDQVVVQVDGKLRYYSYNDGWGYTAIENNKFVRKSEAPTIQPGQGCWVQSAKGTTFTWQSVAAE